MVRFNLCRHGLMPNLIKKAWTVPTPHVLLQYLPPFLHTYQLCLLFPAEATYAVLLCRDKRLAFDKVTTDSMVKPISINTEKFKLKP